MGHVKQPKSVDFTIASEPLTARARLEISQFILNYKKKAALKKSSANKKARTTKPKRALAF
jgi:hypothetical protein